MVTERKRNFITKMLKTNDIYEKFGIKCIREEAAKEIFFMLDIKVFPPKDEKSFITNAVYCGQFTSFFVKANVIQDNIPEELAYSVRITNSKLYTLKQIEEAVTENLYFKILSEYSYQEDK